MGFVAAHNNILAYNTIIQYHCNNSTWYNTIISVIEQLIDAFRFSLNTTKQWYKLYQGITFYIRTL